MREGFFKSSVDKKINTDEWGSFMSGYAPLKNGKGQYLVGMDMWAEEVQYKLRNLRVSGILSLLCSIILALVFSRLLSTRFLLPPFGCSSPVQRDCQWTLERTSGDSHGQSIGSSDRRFQRDVGRSGKSEEPNRHVEDVLKQAKNDLEARVMERFSSPEEFERTTQS